MNITNFNVTVTTVTTVTTITTVTVTTVNDSFVQAPRRTASNNNLLRSNIGDLFIILIAKIVMMILIILLTL